MTESLRSDGGENPGAEQWEDLAEQIASHSTVDSKGETVYLGRGVDEAERAKVEESGFEKPGEAPRGSSYDRHISYEVYPQQEGESDVDYETRLKTMKAESARDLNGDAITDATKEYYRKSAEYQQGRATRDEIDKARGEFERAGEDKKYYRGVPEKEALGIAEQFGPVESVESKHLESVRGRTDDWSISKEVYPQQEGESDVDYETRLKTMKAESARDLNGDAITDATKEYYRKSAEYQQGRATYDEVEKAYKKLDLMKSLHEKGKI